MTSTADRLIAKLKEFAGTLDPEELAALEALLAPAISLANDDVAGFAATPGIPGHLPAELVEGIQAAGLVIDKRRP